MNKEVKIFNALGTDELEDKINAWLSSYRKTGFQSKDDVAFTVSYRPDPISISTSCRQSRGYTATLIIDWIEE